MDERILVEVHVPAVQQIFDVLLPTEFTIGEVKEILCEMLYEITQGAYVPSDTPVLYYPCDQVILGNTCTVVELGLLHGDVLIIW